MFPRSSSNGSGTPPTYPNLPRLSSMTNSAALTRTQSLLFPSAPPALHRSASVQDEIKLIARDSSLTPEEKTRLIQRVYTRNAPRDEKIKAEAASIVCKHYIRNCDLKAFCCGIFYPCRLCHDEHTKDHKIDRFATREMRCRLCKLVQPVGPCCANAECTWKKTRYYCDICKLWVDNEDREVFHCDKCNICRVGRREDFFHCDVCHLCLSNELRNNHTCLRNTADNLCPICNDYMFSSTTNVFIMPCGHSIHTQCFSEHVKRGSHTCPMCKKTSVRDVQRDSTLEAAIRSSRMPEEYTHWKAHILCNDCEKKSICAYHFYGHQCEKCRSFNTSILDIQKNNATAIPTRPDRSQTEDTETEEEDDVAASAYDEGASL